MSTRSAQAPRYRQRLGHFSKLCALSIVLLALGCGSGPMVERQRHGIVETSRVVSPAAYAWYGRAIRYVRLGDTENARRAFKRVLDLDPRSGAAWAGLAKTHCAASPERARALFEQGLDNAAEKAPVHLGIAQCSLLWGEPDLAVQSARHALLLDPWSPEATTLLVAGLDAMGETEEASRISRAGELFLGESPSQEESAEDAVALALALENLALARQFAAGHLPSGELAALAYYLGKDDLAKEQADFVLSADPNNADAWLVRAMLRPELADIPSAVPLAEASPMAVCLLARHLERHAGEEPARQVQRRVEREGDASTSLSDECSLRTDEGDAPPP